MEERLYTRDVSFDADPEEDHDNAAFVPARTLEDRRYDPSRLVEQSDGALNREERVQAALSQLDERSRAVVRARWLDEPKATLQDLAKTLKVSAERVRQIETAAFKKLAAVLKNNA